MKLSPASSTLAREARRMVKNLIGTRAGCKTYKAYHSQCIKELERRAKAWEKISGALDANAEGYSHCSAADVCAVGFSLQERLANGDKI